MILLHITIPDFVTPGQTVWVQLRCVKRFWGPEKHAFPHLSYHTNFGHSRSHNMNIIMDIHQKNLTSSVPTLKVTGIEVNQSATYDFLLVIHSKHAPISYHFCDKHQLQSKPPGYSTPVLMQFLLEFCNDSSAQKLVMPILGGGKS